MVQEFTRRGREPPGVRGMKEYDDDDAAPSLIVPERPSFQFEESLIQSTDQHPKPTVNRIELRSVSASNEEAATNHREVTFIGGPYDVDTELPTDSKISLAGQDATLIMAFDNERFFDSDDGYQGVLIEASQAMERLGQDETQPWWQEPLPEMNWLGWLWRSFVIRAILLTTDSENRLRITRFLQNSLAFMMAYESFALGGIIRIFDVDDRSKDRFTLRLAFQNRNASRFMMQALTPRWDWLWHTGTSVTNSRWFEIFGLVPFIGITSFPATENFPSSKNHVINGNVRTFFFPGSWISRLLSGNQEGLILFNPQAPAQNLAAENNGFEASARNQFGTTFGREKTFGFRLDHRLAIDESIVRSFQNTPATVIVNNGVEHVLRCLANHWRNMLYQDNGNFAHQRMEQLNPFEALRFFMPIVLSTLANLRGRNVWDMTTLGPFIKRLQLLNPDKIRRVASSGNDIEKADEAYAAEIYG